MIQQCSRDTTVVLAMNTDGNLVPRENQEVFFHYCLQQLPD